MKNESVRIFLLSIAILFLVIFGVSISYFHEPRFKESNHVLPDSNQDPDSLKEKPAETPKPLLNPLHEKFIEKILNSTISLKPNQEPYEFKDGTFYFIYEPCEGDCALLDPYPNSNYVIGMQKDKIAIGELDEDGKEDAALIFGERYGGTGYFVSLAVFRNNNDQPEFVTAKSLGDRMVVNSIKIENRLIKLELLTHDSGEPMCCPNTLKNVTYELVEGTLLEKE